MLQRRVIRAVAAYALLLPVAVVARVPVTVQAWFVGSLALGVLWVASHRRRRSCPRCGSAIPQAFIVCPVCRHDRYARVRVRSRTPWEPGPR